MTKTLILVSALLLTGQKGATPAWQGDRAEAKGTPVTFTATRDQLDPFGMRYSVVHFVPGGKRCDALGWPAEDQACVSIAAAAGIMMLQAAQAFQPKYTRRDVRDDYILWSEFEPTTFHGMCASLLGPKTGKLWAVYHPYGHKKNDDGLIGSEGTETKTFATKEAAVAYAESVCPTK